MRKLPLPALCVGLVLIGTAPTLLAEDWPGTHDLEGPVSLMWEARFNGEMSMFDRVTSLALSPDGGTIFVTGESYGPGWNFDYLTVAYDAATGEPKWTNPARYDGPWSDSDYATQLVVSPDGKTVFVTGTSIGYSAADYDYVTLAYDAETGAPIWESRLHGYERSQLWTSRLVIDPAGEKLFLTATAVCSVGECVMPPSAFRCPQALVAYDTSNGSEAWFECREEPMQAGEFPAKLAVSPDGTRVFLAGTRHDPVTGDDYLTVAYDADGVEKWTSSFAKRGPDCLRAMTVSADGTQVFVTGMTGRTRASLAAGRRGVVSVQRRDSMTRSATSIDDSELWFNYATVAYDAASGDEQWIAVYDGGLGRGDDRAHGIAASPAGGLVFVTGRSESLDSGHDYATIAYDAADGTQRWVQRFDGPDSDYDSARGVMVSPNGRSVFVAGECWGERAADWTAVGYNALTGEQRWVACYDGPLSHTDFCRAMAVSPDNGHFYVGGHSVGISATGYDFTTNAYSVLVLVDLDVTLGPPPINPRSNQPVPIVIFGSESFPVSEIAVPTLRIGRAGPVPLYQLIDGVPVQNQLADINGDGILDLQVSIRARDLGLGCDDTSLTLSGVTNSDVQFEGSDEVKVHGCP